MVVSYHAWVEGTPHGRHNMTQKGDDMGCVGLTIAFIKLVRTPQLCESWSISATLVKGRGIYGRSRVNL